MKTLLIFSMFSLMMTCNYSEDYTMYEPVVLNRSDFENAVKIENPKSIQKSGKIYKYNNLLFVNDVNSGFHIFDNTDPQNPEKIKFLNAPGSTDLAIKNNVLYINQAVDLIAVIYQNETLSVNKRVKKVFPIMQSPDGYYHHVPDDKVVVDWKLKN